MAIRLHKELLLAEDVEFGFDVTTQERGGNQLNSHLIPYTAIISIGDRLDNIHTIDASNTAYAYKDGDPLQTFQAALPILDEDVVRLVDMNIVDAAKANKTSVLMRDDSLNNDGYIPQFTYDPSTKGYVDTSISDKFVGAITVQFIAKSVIDGTTDVTVTVTGGVITGVV